MSGFAAAVTRDVLAAPPRLGAVRLVAVDGPSGSGKSTLAAALVEAFAAAGASVALVSTDDFATWDDPFAWWPRLREGVLAPLARGRPGGYRRTEWTGGEPHPGSWVTIATPEVLIVEGVSAGRRSVCHLLSASLWVECPAGERLERAVARDGESSRPALVTWQNVETGWYAVDRTAERSTHRPPSG
ncbi:uridine kinase [Actinokineospora guangxiensis]|uniref:Uridine kinase n=1 Tax=Actinokineospora guangxiensis TaxID=1490288 RepID=A0ABW0EX61_9PSEU